VGLLLVHGEVAVLGGRGLLTQAVAVGREDGEQLLLLLLGLGQVGGGSGEEHQPLSITTRPVQMGG